MRKRLRVTRVVIGKTALASVFAILGLQTAFGQLPDRGVDRTPGTVAFKKGEPKEFLGSDTTIWYDGAAQLPYYRQLSEVANVIDRAELAKIPIRDTSKVEIVRKLNRTELDASKQSPAIATRPTSSESATWFVGMELDSTTCSCTLAVWQ